MAAECTEPPADPGPEQRPAPGLDEILRRTPEVWRGRGRVAAGASMLPTGFPELDAVLGGWPRGALAELAVPAWGIGELRLLLPALRAIQHEGRSLAFIAPPYRPYAPALADAGLDLRRLLLLDRPPGERDLWWALELLLRSADCGLVLAWPSRPGNVTVLRRLQLAAAEGDALGLLLAAEHPSGTPAALRLRLEAAAAGVRVHVQKCRSLAGVAAVDVCW